MSDIRVVLADDHPVVRAGLAALLGSLSGIDVVGVAADGREAVREVVLHRPNVAVLDLQMPGQDGFAATREIARVAPEVAVLVLTMFDDDDSVFAAMRAGARGYVVKGAEQEEIGRAIRAVASGEAIFGPEIAQRVLRFFCDPGAGGRSVPRADCAGTRDPRPACRRDAELHDRRASRLVAEDRGQPPVLDLHQASGRRPGAGDSPGEGRGARIAPLAVVRRSEQTRFIVCERRRSRRARRRDPRGASESERSNQTRGAAGHSLELPHNHPPAGT